MSLVGTVKLFHADKGFGFVTSADGTDVFLHVKACVDGGVPQANDVLAYDLQESKMKPGQMQACNVSGGTGQKGGCAGGLGGAMMGGCAGGCLMGNAGTSGACTGADLSGNAGTSGACMGADLYGNAGTSGACMGPGADLYGNAGTSGACMGPCTGCAAACAGGACGGALGTGACQGSVKLFNPDKGFGFVIAADGAELFVHAKGVVDGSILQAGDKVSFDIEESKMKPGQMQACNVAGGTGVKGGAGKGFDAWGCGGKGGGCCSGKGGGSCQGTCKNFNAEKGFGFVTSDDGPEYFMHMRFVADGNTPQPGDRLSFDIEESKVKPGQMQAIRITGGTGWGKGAGKGCGKMDCWGDGSYGKACGWGGGKGKGGPYGDAWGCGGKGCCGFDNWDAWGGGKGKGAFSGKGGCGFDSWDGGGKGAAFCDGGCKGAAFGDGGCFGGDSWNCGKGAADSWGGGKGNGALWGDAGKGVGDAGCVGAASGKGKDDTVSAVMGIVDAGWGGGDTAALTGDAWGGGCCGGLDAGIAGAGATW